MESSGIGVHLVANLKVILQGQYLLRFGMVDFAATVWINGQLIGKSEGPENPFEFDITDALDYENENWIVVRVLNPTNEPIRRNYFSANTS